jgi:ABC-type uncharacterized transport system permease subunit
VSLKAFHVIFISAAVLLAVWFGVWAVGQQRQLLAVGSFAAAVALVGYEVWFLRKTRQVSSW